MRGISQPYAISVPLPPPDASFPSPENTGDFTDHPFHKFQSGTRIYNPVVTAPPYLCIIKN